MAATVSIPHPNVPTTDLGNYQLKNVVMLFNENFTALLGYAQSLAASVSDLDENKADSDHNHDDDYAPLSHTHQISDITLLESTLENKSDVGHTHSQYLTSENLASMQWGMDQVTGLSAALLQKSNVGHTHTMAEITDLAAALSTYASAEYVNTLYNNLLSQMLTSSSLESDKTKFKADTKDGSAGTGKTIARADHQHPLNVAVVDEETEESDFQAGDVMLEFGEDETGEGDSEHYARMNHKHQILADNEKGAQDVILGVAKGEKHPSLFDSIGTDVVAAFTAEDGRTMTKSLYKYLNANSLAAGQLVVPKLGSDNLLELGTLDNVNSAVLSTSSEGVISWATTIAQSMINWGEITNITSDNFSSNFDSCFNAKGIESFPGFGTTHTTAAYGDHNHSGVYLESIPDKYLTIDDINLNYTNTRGVTGNYHANAKYTGTTHGAIDWLYDWIGAYSYTSLKAAVEALCDFVTESELTTAIAGCFSPSNPPSVSDLSDGGDVITTDDFSEAFITAAGNGKSTSVTVVTGLTWSGTSLVAAKKNLTFTNGLLTATATATSDTIGTVVYSA